MALFPMTPRLVPCASMLLQIHTDGIRKEQEKARPWHVIPDGPNLMSRLPRQSHFVTILSYRLARDSSPAMYSGPLYGDCDAEDVECAFADLRCCIELLHAEYDCPPEAIRVWHSGNRGPHFTIPSLVFGGQEGHPQLPRIYAAMIQQLFPPSIASTLDRSVYR
jgi:putative DNA primase/helicase